MKKIIIILFAKLNLSNGNFFLVLLKIAQAAVLTREMQAMNVDFKFFEEYNQLAEKNRDKMDQSRW